MAGAYLTPAEIKELTGYETRAAARRWLDRNGWPHADPGNDGWPRVLREYHDARLSGQPAAKPRKSAGPNWSRAA